MTDGGEENSKSRTMCCGHCLPTLRSVPSVVKFLFARVPHNPNDVGISGASSGNFASQATRSSWMRRVSSAYSSPV